MCRSYLRKIRRVDMLTEGYRSDTLIDDSARRPNIVLFSGLITRTLILYSPGFSGFQETLILASALGERVPLYSWSDTILPFESLTKTCAKNGCDSFFVFLTDVEINASSSITRLSIALSSASLKLGSDIDLIEQIQDIERTVFQPVLRWI